MTVSDVETIMEQWAPRWIAWDRDNVGLQVGDRNASVRRILLCLDVTRDIVDEAIRKKADMLISHHPLLFHPPTSITKSDLQGELILRLAENRIALYSSHTNLDFTRDGVSFALAHALGLRNIRFLSSLKGLMSKLAVFVPQGSVGKVLEAMADAGAGTIGNYSHCSFQVDGRGTFLGSAEANPAVGKRGVLETTAEVRLEMILPRSAVGRVATAMKSVHPYEEVAYDVYPLDNESTDFGMGAIGELESSVSLKDFLKRVRKALDAEAVKAAGNAKGRIQRVAVCGGSGSDLLPAAIQSGAEAFVTADVRYHTFLDADGRLALVDAGHWETEHPVLPVIESRLQQACDERKERVSITVTRQRTSPIYFY